MRISDWSSDVCSSDLGIRYSKMGAVMLFRETSRRQLMFGVGTFAILAHATGAFAAGGKVNMRGKARPLPLGAVRLKPSDFATAVEVNRTYLHRLEPEDRKSTRLNSSH